MTETIKLPGPPSKEMADKIRRNAPYGCCHGVLEWWATGERLPGNKFKVDEFMAACPRGHKHRRAQMEVGHYQGRVQGIG